MKVFRYSLLAISAIMAMLLGLVAVAFADQDEIQLAQGGLKGVPAEFQPWLFKADAACPHPELTPALLAAQLNQESGFSTSRSTVSSAGAQGPAQFMPGTWATWGRDDDDNGQIDPYDIGDAVMAQGRMMCSLLGQAKASGISGDVRSLALAGYNAGWGRVEQAQGIPPIAETQNYVRIILATLSQFEGPAALQISGSGAGANAVRKAASRLGTPYAYGGGTPQGPSTGWCDGINGYDRTTGDCVADNTVGFDCSSLTQYGYWADLKLPRTAAAQYDATADRPVARAELQVGDLLFWRDSGGFIYHVAFWAGDGRVLHAPRTGKNVELVQMSSAMPAADYLGATRP